MRSFPVGRRMRAHLVTEAQEPKSQDISNRERRYLIMMAIRLVCFVAAIVMYVEGAGWYSLVPAVGAVVLPYIAVVFANGGREPSNARGLADFQPPQLPDRQIRALPQGRPHIVGYVTYGDSEHSNAGHNATGHAAQSSSPGDSDPRTAR